MRPTTTNNRQPTRINNASTASSTHGGGGGIGSDAWARSVAAPIRDPKSRAKSREYLKQCLQEISYLTSREALNPLPNKVGVSITIPPIAGVGGDGGEGVPTVMEVPERPRKTLDEGLMERTGPSSNALPSTSEKQVDDDAGNAVDGEEQHPTNEADDQTPASSHSQPNQEPSSNENMDHSHSNGSAISSTQSSEPKPSSLDVNRYHVDPSSSFSEETEDPNKLLTAIYKPESKEAWKEALRAANERAEEAKKGHATVGRAQEAQNQETEWNQKNQNEVHNVSESESIRDVLVFVSDSACGASVLNVGTFFTDSVSDHLQAASYATSSSSDAGRATERPLWNSCGQLKRCVFSFT